MFLSDGKNGKDGLNGQNGTNATIEVTGTTTGLPGTQASVIPTYSSNNTHVALAFIIPEGQKGEQGIQGEKGDKGDIGSTYLGEWVAQSYSSNSLVRSGTNLWFASANVSSSDVPGTSSSWLLYLSDGEQGQKGETGETIYPIAQSTTNLPPGTDAYVTNRIEGTNSYFYFGIPQGEKGETGEKGGALLPRGIYTDSGEYNQYDLVRFETAQYYVSVETPSPISGIVPTNTDYWTMFLKDGEGIAANATLIQENETEYPGTLMLDTNTLVVTNIDDVAHLTVVGGGGGDATLLVNGTNEYVGPLNIDIETLAVVGSESNQYLTVVGTGNKQWDIDINGGIMPSLEVTVGPWEYDDDNDIMPPLDYAEPIIPNTYRMVTTEIATVKPIDYIIWMDSISAQTNQTLIFPNMGQQSQTVIVRQLGNYETTLVRGTNTYSLAGDGASIAMDWLPIMTNWYWRGAY
jgi:hypothetical protein